MDGKRGESRAWKSSERIGPFNAVATAHLGYSWPYRKSSNLIREYLGVTGRPIGFPVGTIRPGATST